MNSDCQLQGPIGRGALANRTKPQDRGQLTPGGNAKLAQLHFATTLEDLRAPPGNRLEALQGDREGQHSIRINKRFRICFVWREGKAHEIEIVDYHRG